MRILYVIAYYKPAYVYGGPARSIPAMCEALAASGAEVTVLTTNANGRSCLDVPLGQAVSVAGVEVFYYPVAPILPHRLFYSPQLARACAQKIGQADLAVLATFWTPAMGPAVAACKRGRVPYVVPLYGQLFPWALRRKRYKKLPYLALFGRRYLDSAAALQCTDPAEAQAAAALSLRPPAFVVPNGVDASRFARLPDRGALRQRLGIPPGDRVLLFLGRLHRIKRPDIAVEALAATRSVPGEPVHLVLAGPDEEHLAPALHAQAQHLGCADRVHLAGLLQGDDVLHALADADLMLMPSEIQESFGMAAVEAMAAGLPVLVSDGVPVGRWAEEAAAGRMAACTAQAFARATCELLSAPGQLKAMGERGQALVRCQFDIPIVARQMLAQYQAIVRTGRPLPRDLLQSSIS